MREDLFADIHVKSLCASKILPSSETSGHLSSS